MFATIFVYFNVWLLLNTKNLINFIFPQLTVNNERPSSLKLNSVILKADENYRGVLVGWSVEVIIHD